MAEYYTPVVPDVSGFNNMDLNPLGSAYGAAPYSHNTTAIVERFVRSLIYDAAPQQYLDLLLLNMQSPETVPTDEFNYHEMTYGRDPIVTTVLGGTISSGSSQVVPVTDASFDFVSVDSILVYNDNTQGTVTAKNAGATPKTITITAQTGGTLPALASGSSYTFAYHSPVEADGADSISTYFRQETIERTNFVQLLVKAMRFGRLELHKYQQTGKLQNYLQMQNLRMIQQFKTSISNIYWNGKMGEVTLANGAKAKTAGGVFPTMVAASSPNYTHTLAAMPDMVAEALLATEYKSYGYTKFLYGTPRVLYHLSQQFKRDLTRYAPNDMVANLNLSQIDIGSSAVVLVPMKRFEESSCFPPSFRSRYFILDQASIRPVKIFPEEMGSTLSRVNNGTLKNYTDMWVSADFSIMFHNPLGCAYGDITDLP